MRRCWISHAWTKWGNPYQATRKQYNVHEGLQDHPVTMQRRECIACHLVLVREVADAVTVIDVAGT